MAKKSKKDAAPAAKASKAVADALEPAAARKKKKTVEAPPEAAPEEPSQPETPPEMKGKKKSGKGKAKKDADVSVEPPAPEPEPTPEPSAESAEVSEPAPTKKGRKGKAKKNEEIPAEQPVAEASSDEVAPAQDEAASLEAPAETTESAPAAETLPENTEPAAQEKPVDLEEIERNVEALLFAAEEPLQARELARCSGSDSPTIRKLIPKIKERYAAERRPWDIAEVANGWRLVTRPEYYPVIQKLKTQTLQRKLTQAALETLALIAYRQPLSRAEIENVRGVGAGPVLRQLLERKLIKISGRGTGLGQPLLYGTTDYFLEHFGLNTIQELPKPGEFKQ